MPTTNTMEYFMNASSGMYTVHFVQGHFENFMKYTK